MNQSEPKLRCSFKLEITMFDPLFEASWYLLNIGGDISDK